MSKGEPCTWNLPENRAALSKEGRCRKGPGARWDGPREAASGLQHDYACSERANCYELLQA